VWEITVVIPGHKKMSALVLQDCVTTRAGATKVAQDLSLQLMLRSCGNQKKCDDLTRVLQLSQF
jgi:hypothetical protein